MIDALVLASIVEWLYNVHTSVGVVKECYLVDPASSHVLVSKIKPCMYLQISRLIEDLHFGEDRFSSKMEKEAIIEIDLSPDGSRGQFDGDRARDLSIFGRIANFICDGDEVRAFSISVGWPPSVIEPFRHRWSSSI
ncbi:hypothetical protein QYF36_024193 [Acer negundo]|nr:hypothetical protein QYF36_024193 [Acer negundo]